MRTSAPTADRGTESAGLLREKVGDYEEAVIWSLLSILLLLLPAASPRPKTCERDLIPAEKIEDRVIAAILQEPNDGSILRQGIARSIRNGTPRSSSCWLASSTRSTWSPRPSSSLTTSCPGCALCSQRTDPVAPTRNRPTGPAPPRSRGSSPRRPWRPHSGRSPPRPRPSLPMLSTTAPGVGAIVDPAGNSSGNLGVAEDQDHGTGMGPNCPPSVGIGRHRPARELPADLHRRPR